jgi:dTDP-4-amino-4,6-dideoxygalactose transaminase
MIDFNSLRPVYASLAGEIQEAIQRVLNRGWYVLGPEVEAFEEAFAKYHGVDHAVSVASGTDAIELALRAAGIGPGDDVITVAHTAVATVCAVERAGATPVLIDVCPLTHTMDPQAAEAAITPRTKAILPVHLYGHPADMGSLIALADKYHLLLVEDCAQAHGARWGNRLAGTMGRLGAFSFYPTKNMGAFGDGGAVVTNDSQLAEHLRRLRNYGQTTRYHHAHRGINSRLDEIQAAILRVKLAHLDRHNEQRRQLAGLYHQLLTGVSLPLERSGQPQVHHVYHLYVIRHPKRDWLRERLQTRGISTLIHYPIPIHRQPAYENLGYRAGSLPVTERLAAEVLSLPLYIGLPEADLRTVAQAVNDCVEEVSLAA